MYRLLPLPLLVLTLFLLNGRASSALAMQALHLPYPAGVFVAIIEGYNGGTHNGVERYSLDLVRGDGATSGSPVLAPASGTVAFAQDPASDHGCIGVAMDDAGDFHYMLCHIILNHSYSYGERIQVGQMLGSVAAPGLVGNNGTSHIHMQLYTLPDGVRTPQPYAPPDGIPLEGVTLSPDGSYNQWACSTAPCFGLVSANPGAAALSGVASSVPVTSSKPALTGLPAGPNNAGVKLGGSVIVAGTGDCLRVHLQASLSAAGTNCLPDGTSAVIVEGPVQAEGHSWWYLFNLGWVVGDYLKPASGTLVPPSAPAQGPPPSPPALPSTPQAPTLSAPSAPNASPTGTSSALTTGALVQVSGTGDCLKIHSAAGLTAPTAGCLADGSYTSIVDGPRSADGHVWWLLEAGGWAVADYLRPVPY